ncbi:P-loop NTPase family protein [Aliihoeflea sp. PC F10.4]
MIAQAVSEDRWIFDGNSSGTLDLRLPRTDLIIWLRMPRALCLRRVIGRRFRYAGKSRPDMADGCPEKIDWEFLRYIWNFESKETPEIMNEIAKHGSGVPIIELRTPDAVSALLAHAKMAV